MFADYGRLLWSVYNLGRRVWKTPGSPERHCEEKERRELEDGVEGEPSTQETASKTGSDEKVSCLAGLVKKKKDKKK